MRLIALLLALGLVTPPPGDATDVHALALLLQIENSIEEDIVSGELGQVHNEDAFLYSALSALGRSGTAEQRKSLDAVIPALGRSVAELHAAADTFDRTLAQERWKATRKAFEQVVAVFDAETIDSARDFASHFTCPMHPDVVGKRGEACPKCGMPLDTRSRIWLGPAPNAKHPSTVTAEVCTDVPLRKGQEAQGTLKLTSIVGEPLVLEDLREVHTKKIHLLIVDPTLTDYHHEHPIPTETPGEYSFRFTPRMPGPYRVFADLQPLLTGFQEYAKAVIAAPTASDGEVEKTYARTRAQGGLEYALTFETETLHARVPASAHVRVSRAGRPFFGLEPLMATFAHLVGFHERGDIVLHMHPIESRALTAEDRAGPELSFRFFADTPGYYRLFLQVQVDGESQFVPFGIDVVG
jgi:hypothetical protein